MRLIAKRSSLFILALVVAVVSLTAVACAPTSANSEGNASPGTLPRGGSSPSGGTEKAALFASDFGTYASFAAASGSQQAGIWVSGLGTVTLEPDIAFITLGVEAKATTVKQANAQAATAMDAIFAVLRARGVEDKDIRTTYYNIQPQYQYPRDESPKLVGYTVTNQVSVKLRDLDSIGEVIDEVATAGGDNTRINGISFTIDDDSEARVQARELAVKDAIAKAEQFAALTGVTLGNLMYISESGGGVYTERALKIDVAYAPEAGVAPPTPISGGELDVRISVQAVFGIE